MAPRPRPAASEKADGGPAGKIVVCMAWEQCSFFLPMIRLLPVGGTGWILEIFRAGVDFRLLTLSPNVC